MSKKSILIEAEVVSPKSGKLAATGLHNHYHHCAQAAAAQATGYAILCGLELQRIRAEVASKGGRPKNSPTQIGEFSGGWEAWVKANCEFSSETARKYMAVSEGIKSRLQQVGMAKSLAGLIDFAPSSLADGDRAKLLKSVSKVTEGQTLQQLYMDFGITKKDPRQNLKKGGATHTKGRGNVANLDEEDARAMCNEFLRAMSSWLHAGHHQVLPRKDIQHLDQQLLAAREMLAPFLKK